MKKEIEYCGHCQQIIKQPHTIKLNKMWIKVLGFYRDEEGKQKYAIHYKDEKFQTINRVSTGILSHMKSFGLVELCVQRGWWAITQKGIDFLDGKINLPLWVEVLDKNVVNLSDERLYIDKLQ